MNMQNDMIQSSLDGLRSKDADCQDQAFQSLMLATKEPVDWAYTVWDDLLQTLKDGDNRQRAIASQVLCSLAKSDPENRMLKDIGALIAATKDEQFVTARHCLQSLWKVGVAGESQRKLYMKGLIKRFAECTAEKNCTLIRYDILESMRRVYDVTNDESIAATTASLIETEEDPKYRKKYLTLWRKKK